LSLAKRRLNFQWEWLPQFPTKGLTEMFMANRRSPLLNGRHRGLPLLHARHKGLPLPFAIRHSLPFFQSPVANHQSLSFSPFAIRRRSRQSLLAIRCSLPFSPVANHQSPFTAVLTSRQSLIASRCRPRQSLIASRCLSRYSPLTTPAISSPLSGYNQASNPQA
jgi:hypothetical protein